MWGGTKNKYFSTHSYPNIKMKEDKTTIVEKKNPYKYNGEILKSTQFSPQPKSLVNTDNQSVTKTKKFYIGTSYTT